MANSEHLEILRKGVKIWNEWRDSNPGMKINLCEADLVGAELSGVNFFEVDLREANLREANLRDADLRGANLYRANLVDARLAQANLREANLVDTNIQMYQLLACQLNNVLQDEVDALGQKVARKLNIKL